MFVIEFVLFSVTLKALSASSVFSNFARLLLLSKQRSVARSRVIEKKIVTLFFQCQYKREVHCDRTM